MAQVDKKVLKYSWPDNSSMGYEFTNGTGTVDFEGENCLLSVSGSFKKESTVYDVSVTFAMEEKK